MISLIFGGIFIVTGLATTYYFINTQKCNYPEEIPMENITFDKKNN